MSDQINEVLTTPQRIKRAQIMKRHRAKIELARKRARGRLASGKKIVDRAMRAARNILRQRVAGKRGASYYDLSPAEKKEIDKQLEKRKKAIKKIATRLIMKVRQKEFARFKSFFQGDKMHHLHSEQFQDTMDQVLMEAQSVFLTEETNEIIEQVVDGPDLDMYKLYFVEALALEDGDEEMALHRVELVAELMEARTGRVGTRSYKGAERRFTVGGIGQAKRRKQKMVKPTTISGGIKGQRSGFVTRRRTKSGQVKVYKKSRAAQLFQRIGALASLGKVGGTHVPHASAPAGRRIVKPRKMK